MEDVKTITRKEFYDYAFSSNTEVYYDGVWRRIVSVHFGYGEVKIGTGDLDYSEIEKIRN